MGKLCRVGLNRLLWMSIGLMVGTAFSVRAASENLDTLYRKLQVLAEVLGHVENYHVDRVDAEELVYGAVSGAVQTLDPHTMFFPPDQYQSLLESTEGEYAGIGVELDAHRRGAQILAVLEGSPAQKAGLQRGDLIVLVDGKPTEGMSVEQVQVLLRGPVGTKIVMELERGELTGLRTYTLVRSWIRLPPLDHVPLPGGVHYVHLKVFPRRVSRELEDLLQRKHPKGLVLDLRGNPGGLFDEAIAVCDLFLSGGPIVTATGRQGQQVERHEARERATQGSYPLAILIDEGSASAAEVVAGALKDRGRARLYGQRSYGKGSVQTILDLSDGSGLKLTIARYVTPSGNPIDGHGIEPNVTCAPREGEKDEAFEQAMAWVRDQIAES